MSDELSDGNAYARVAGWMAAWDAAVRTPLPHAEGEPEGIAGVRTDEGLYYELLESDIRTVLNDYRIMRFTRRDGR